jgi:uncharacterized repeat protein (TIGR02543 family)
MFYKILVFNKNGGAFMKRRSIRAYGTFVSFLLFSIVSSCSLTPGSSSILSISNSSGHGIESSVISSDSSISSSTSSVSSSSSSIDSSSTSSVIVERYTVQFFYAEQPDIMQVKSGDKVTKPEDPVINGYRFIGWYLNDVKYDFDLPVTGNLILVAKFEKINIQYIVNFDSDGGSPINSITVVDGNKVTKPTDPTKDGYRFIGWYKDDVLFDFDTEIRSDVSLKAKWEEIVEQGMTLNQFYGYIEAENYTVNSTQITSYIFGEIEMSYQTDILYKIEKRNDYIYIDMDYTQDAQNSRDYDIVDANYYYNLGYDTPSSSWSIRYRSLEDYQIEDLFGFNTFTKDGFVKREGSNIYDYVITDELSELIGIDVGPDDFSYTLDLDSLIVNMHVAVSVDEGGEIVRYVISNRFSFSNLGITRIDYPTNELKLAIANEFQIMINIAEQNERITPESLAAFIQFVNQKIEDINSLNTDIEILELYRFSKDLIDNFDFNYTEVIIIL